MHIGRIDGATRNLGAPADWDQRVDGPCATLPVRDEMTTAGRGMTSAWFPTPEEIERIRDGAPIYLTVLGATHPLVAMGVGEATAPKPRARRPQAGRRSIFETAPKAVALARSPAMRGLSLREIAARLADAGFKTRTGSAYSPSVVSRMLYEQD